MSTAQVALLASVQQFWSRQHGLYIDGTQQASQSEQRLTVWNPATGQVSPVHGCRAADVVNPVCRRGAPSSPAAGLGARADRERILLRFADLVEQHGEELAQLETLEQEIHPDFSRI